MPNNQANSGSDLIPVQYNVTGVATTYFWDTPQRLRMPEYFYKNVVTPSWSSVAVTGPSQIYAAQLARGVAAVRISHANLSSTQTPIYVDAILEGVWYKISGGAVATIPIALIDVINQSSTYHATLV